MSDPNPNVRPLRVLLNESHWAVICEKGLYLLRQETAKHRSNPPQGYQSYANPHAVAVMGDRYLVIPGISKGVLRLVDLSNLKASMFNAHGSSLRAVALSQDEDYVATCSTTGTLIRIWSTKDCSKIAEYRRGLDDVDVFSLAFSPDNAFLALTSDKSTLHIFELPMAKIPPPTPTTQAPSKSGHSRRTSESTTKGMPIPQRNPSSYPKSSIQSPRGSPNLAGTPPTRTGLPGPARDQSPDPMTESFIMMRPEDSVSVAGSPRTHMAPTRFDHSRKSSVPRNIRFQDPTPAPSAKFSTSPSYDAYSDYAPSNFSTATHQAQPPPRSATKYGALARLPFAPRILTDTYSSASAPFFLPSAFVQPTYTVTSTSSITSRVSALAQGLAATSLSPGTASSSSSKSHAIPSAPQGAPLNRVAGRTPQTIASGAPNKGQIAWRTNDELVVVSAGKGGRWEKFGVGRAENGDVVIKFIGWRPVDDDGMD